MAKQTNRNSYARKQIHNSQAYVNGNAVKKSEVFVPYPERERQRERKRRAQERRQLEEQIRRGRKEMREFSLMAGLQWCFVLVIAVIIKIGSICNIKDEDFGKA
ncbi:MAG: hypothetical protein ACLRZ7_09335 [Lachnospiraceae bacterium]